MYAEEDENFKADIEKGTPFALMFLNGSKLIIQIFFGQRLSENKQFFNKTDLDEYLTHIKAHDTLLNDVCLDLKEKKNGWRSGGGSGGPPPPGKFVDERPEKKKNIMKNTNTFCYIFNNFFIYLYIFFLRSLMLFYKECAYVHIIFSKFSFS